MSSRVGRWLGVSEARAVAATVGAVLVAGGTLAAALGGRAGAPGWLRIVFALLAVVVAIVVVGLTLAEQTAAGRARARRRRGWVEDHFWPRGRGVARKAERGQYFTGRARALRELVGWLSSDRGGLCVVTGDPGSGKSAVLGCLVALADREQRRELGVARLAAEMLPPQGSIDVAVWAKGLTMADVIEATAATIGASASAPSELIDAALARGGPLVVVVDALDEAGGEGEAWRIAQRLLKPLAAAGREADVKVLVGTRRGAGGELLDALGPGKRVIDLDTPEYLERDDLVDYVRRRLLRDGEPGAPTPYRRQPAVASQVAQAVADRASPSFLIAQLASRSLADADEVVDTTRRGWETQFPADVGSAMDDYLDRFEQESDRRRARDLLTALAYAEGAGLPRDHDDDLWPRLAGALAAKAYDGDDVDWVLHTAAADLVDETRDNGTLTCRLFHQALSDHLRGPAERQRDRQRALAGALEGAVPARANDAGRDWARASTYVRTHLATHAAAGGVLDHLLEDPDYLVVADPPRLRRALPAATSPAATDIRRGYRPIAHLLQNARPAERAAYLEMAARRVGATRLAEQIAQRHPDRPWTVPWMSWRASSEHVLTGHAGWVLAVAVGELDGRPVIVSGGGDGTLRVWDLAAGKQLGEPLTGHAGAVRAVAVGELDGRPVIVSGGIDGTLRVWDLAAGQQLGEPLTGHDGAVRAVAVGELDGRPVIVSGGEDGTLRVWDLAAGKQLGEPLTGHAGAVWAVAVGELDGRPVIVSGGEDGTLRVWDLAAGQQLGEPLTGHAGAVWAVAVGELDGRPVIVSGGGDGTLRVWDLAAGKQLGEPLTGHAGAVWAVAVGELDGRPVIVSGGGDGTLRVWDLAAGQQLGEPLTGHAGAVWAVAVGELDGRPVIVSGGGDGTLRVWELAAGQQLGEPLTGHAGTVWAVAVGELDGRPVIVSGGGDGTLRVWDLAGSELAVINVGSPVQATGVRGATIVVGANAGVMALELPPAAQGG